MNGIMPQGGMPPGGAPAGQPQDMDALIQALMQQNPQLAQQLMGGRPPGMGASPMAMPLMGSGAAMMPQPRPSQGYQP